MKIFMTIIKKIVFALFALYTINLIINQTGEILPINIYSILSVTIFGIPAIFALLFLKLFIL